MIGRSKSVFISNFNMLLNQKINVRYPHHITVFTRLSKNADGSYQTALSISASESINQDKYRLDRTNDKNPFWGVTSPRLETTVEMGQHIQNGLYEGVEVLLKRVKENLLPNLLLAHTQDDDWYVSGETVEVPKRNWGPGTFQGDHQERRGSGQSGELDPNPG